MKDISAYLNWIAENAVDHEYNLLIDILCDIYGTEYVMDAMKG